MLKTLYRSCCHAGSRVTLAARPQACSIQALFLQRCSYQHVLLRATSSSGATATAAVAHLRNAALAKLLPLPKSGALTVVEAALREILHAPGLALSVAAPTTAPRDRRSHVPGTLPKVVVSCQDQLSASRAADMISKGTAFSLRPVQVAVRESRPLRFDREIKSIPGAKKVLQRARQEFGIDVRWQVLPQPQPGAASAAAGSPPATADTAVVALDGAIDAATSGSVDAAAAPLADESPTPAAAVAVAPNDSLPLNASEDSANIMTETSASVASVAAVADEQAERLALAAALRSRAASPRDRMAAVLSGTCAAQEAFPPLVHNELYVTCMDRQQRGRLKDLLNQRCSDAVGRKGKPRYAVEGLWPVLQDASGHIHVAIVRLRAVQQAAAIRSGARSKRSSLSAGGPEASAAASNSHEAAPAAGTSNADAARATSGTSASQVKDDIADATVARRLSGFPVHLSKEPYLSTNITFPEQVFPLGTGAIERWAADFNLGIVQWGNFRPLPAKLDSGFPAAGPIEGQRVFAVKVLMPAANRQALLGPHEVESVFRGARGTLVFEDPPAYQRDVPVAPVAQLAATGRVLDADVDSGPRADRGHGAGTTASSVGSGAHCLVRLVYVYHERCPDQLLRAHAVLKLLTDKEHGFGKHLIGSASDHGIPDPHTWKATASAAAAAAAVAAAGQHALKYGPGDR